jgi:hypothetical protein
MGLTGLLSACGGGGSRSSGPSLVGTYLGVADTTLTSPRGSVPVRGSIQLVVAADNTVALGDPGEPPAGHGTLNGNEFTVALPGSFANSPGISCSGTVIFQGTISGVTANGTVSSTAFRCNGVPFELSGTFTATRQALAPRGGAGGEGLGRRLGAAVRAQ